MIVTCTFDQQNRLTGFFVGHPDGRPTPRLRAPDVTRYTTLTSALSVSRLMELRFPGTAWSVTLAELAPPAPVQGAFT